MASRTSSPSSTSRPIGWLPVRSIRPGLHGPRWISTARTGNRRDEASRILRGSRPRASSGSASRSCIDPFPPSGIFGPLRRLPATAPPESSARSGDWKKVGTDRSAYTGRRPLRGGVIGSTPDSGSGSWGSSPCPAACSRLPASCARSSISLTSLSCSEPASRPAARRRVALRRQRRGARRGDRRARADRGRPSGGGVEAIAKGRPRTRRPSPSCPHRPPSRRPSSSIKDIVKGKGPKAKAGDQLTMQYVGVVVERRAVRRLVGPPASRSRSSSAPEW